MKKILIVVLALSLIFISIGINKNLSFAETENVKSYYLIHAESGRVLSAKNEKDRYPIASMVKMMTICLTLEEIDSGRLDLNEKVTISKEAAGMGGSQMFLDYGSQYTVSDLLKGAIVVSANDACVALAERISGSEDSFVNKMNQKAKSLDMNNTNYVNCTGLPKEGGYSSAEDVAKVTAKIINNPIYKRFSKIWLEDYVHPSGRKTVFTNTNKLVRFNPDCTGGKTGFTNEAKFCLSAGGSRNGLNVIAVVIGADSSDIRFKKVTELFNLAFANYEIKEVTKKDFWDKGEKILKANDEKKMFSLENPLKVFKAKTEEMPQFEIKYDFNVISAPVKKGTVVGKATLFVNGKIVDQTDIKANQDINKLSYKEATKKIISNW